MIYKFFSCSTNIPRGLSAYKPQKLVVYCLNNQQMNCFEHDVFPLHDCFDLSHIYPVKPQKLSKRAQYMPNTCQNTCQERKENSKYAQVNSFAPAPKHHMALSWCRVENWKSFFYLKFVVFRFLDGEMISTKRPKVDIQAVSFNWRVFRDCLFFFFSFHCFPLRRLRVTVLAMYIKVFALKFSI